jgi:hypothetical protein
MRRVVLSLVCFGVSVAFCADQKPATSAAATRLGWFGDAACTRERVQAGNVEPNNPECAKRCVKEGSPLGFIDERAKTFTIVNNPEKVINDIGYRVEIAASTTQDNKLEVQSVKHISEINAMCGRRPLKKQ